MTREVWVLEEHSKGEGWYPVRASETRYEVECIHARWPDPKRIVRYVPEPREAAQDTAAKEALQKLDRDITVLDVERRLDGLKVTLLFADIEQAKAVLEPHR